MSLEASVWSLKSTGPRPMASMAGPLDLEARSRLELAAQLGQLLVRKGIILEKGRLNSNGFGSSELKRMIRL